MIKKYVFGNPFPTEAVVLDLNTCPESIPFFLHEENNFHLSYLLEKNTCVYGLGESSRGINKRGYLFHSLCSDTPTHTPDLNSMYGAHNFLLINGTDCFGLFIDCSEQVTFDIGYSDYNELRITSNAKDYILYIILEESLKSIICSFRTLIGESYIPPRWAFGYQQSRWGYQCESDFYEIVEKHKMLDIPLESIYMDIDYMEDYKDFTIDPSRFPNFGKMVRALQKDGIKLVPVS